MFCFMLSSEKGVCENMVPNNKNTCLLKYGLSAWNSVSVAGCLCSLNRQLPYKQNFNEQHYLRVSKRALMGGKEKDFLKMWRNLIASFAKVKQRWWYEVLSNIYLHSKLQF
jgi:hypothetical protein